MRKSGMGFAIGVLVLVGVSLAVSVIGRHAAPAGAAASATYSSADADAQAAAEAATAPESSKEFLQGVVNAIPKEEGWRSLTVSDDTKENEYSIDLDYSQPPADLEGDAESVVRAVLKALVAEGHQPSEENTHVFVSARQSGVRGETSDNMVSLYGMAEYNPSHDSITFEPYKPLFGS
jgi:hypothetical protein